MHPKVRLNPFDHNALGIFAPAPSQVQEADRWPKEKQLQQIWACQRLRRGDLRCLDGSPLQVLHPGFWNHSPGPDFLQAVLRLGDAPPVVGDVEIDLLPSGWRQHGHDTNPHFKKVVLHVVFDTAHPAPHGLPTLALKPFLDAELHELELWMEQPLENTALLKGRCCDPLAQLEAPHATTLVRQAALLRLKKKAHRMLARARQVGWTQALWEELFSALGYRHNSWPMRQIAEQLPSLLDDFPNHPQPVLVLQARLLGIAGFLNRNAQPKNPEAQSFLRELWDVWWRDHARFQPLTLPAQAWNFTSTRPANHPERRLALAAHWLAAPHFLTLLENWALQPENSRPSQLLLHLQPEPLPFWKNHWNLISTASSSPPAHLIGTPRVADIAMNSLLPWLWARAASGDSLDLLHAVENRYLQWPQAQENQILRLARQRLFGLNPNPLPKTAASQQGLLQIASDYCQKSNALCQHCLFPSVVTDFLHHHPNLTSKSPR